MNGVSPNAKAIGLWTVVGIAAVTVWRAHKLGKRNKQKLIPVIWGASILGIIVAAVSDFAPGLGAAFGAAVVLGLLPDQNSVAGIFSGVIGKASGAGSGGGVSPPGGAVGTPTPRKGGV